MFFPTVTTVGGSALGNCKNLLSVTFGTGLTEPTEIKFDIRVFGATDTLTKKMDLILDENVLQLPDLDANIWQCRLGSGTGIPYIWKSITVEKVSIDEIIKNRTVSIFPNPTVSDFTVSFDLEKSCNLQILLCDILGK